MLHLARYLPVLTVSRSARSGEQQLYDKLLTLLKADRLRVSTTRLDEPFRSSAHLARALAKADMLIAESGVISSSARLVFAEKDAVRQEPGEFTFFCADESGLQECAGQIMSWLHWCDNVTPATGAVLIGGKSSRMGQPKHLIEHASGTTWLEHTVTTINPFVENLVISGKGRIPASLKNLVRIDDLPDLQGPLAGIGGLFRSRPLTSWLVTACDMPYISGLAVTWLLDQRRRTCLAVIPQNPKTGRSEPLLGWYNYRCGALIDELISSGSRRISDLCRHNLVLQPQIPDHLTDNWRNINYPEEI